MPTMHCRPVRFGAAVPAGVPSSFPAGRARHGSPILCSAGLPAAAGPGRRVAGAILGLEVVACNHLDAQGHCAAECTDVSRFRPAKHRPPADCTQAVVPLLLALMASAGQVQAARDSSSQQARRQAEGTELQQLGLQHPAPGTHPLAARAWAAAVALLAAAMAQPSVLAGPYMLAAAAAVWRWSGGGGGRGGSSFGLALLRPFTAAYLVALYLWQALSGWAALQPAARVLGLFSLSSAADQGWQQLVPAAVQLAAMLLLFLSLAGAQSEAGSEGGVRPARHAAAAADASWDAAGERSPLLQRQMPQPQQPSTQPSGASPPPRVATDAAAVSVQQLMYTLLLDTAEALCREPAAVAALLCCTAMVQPSALGGLVLLLGLAALLARPAAVALQRWSRALTAALLVSGVCCCERHALCCGASCVWLPALLTSMAACLSTLSSSGVAAELLWGHRGSCSDGHPSRSPGSGPAAIGRTVVATGHLGIRSRHCRPCLECPKAALWPHPAAAAAAVAASPAAPLDAHWQHGPSRWQQRAHFADSSRRSRAAQ